MNESLEEARRYVRRKRIFCIVLGIWIALSLMWFAIDMLDDSSSIWFFWPMLGTGIAVAITGIVLLGIGDSSASIGSAGRSTSICAAEGTSQAVSVLRVGRRLARGCLRPSRLASRVGEATTIFRVTRDR
jgi:2TM domain